MKKLCSPGNFFLGARAPYNEAEVVRFYSQALEEYSPYLDRDLGDVSFCDLGDLVLPPGDVAGALHLIRSLAGEIAGDGKVPLFLGGEHLLTLAVVEALAARYPRLAVLHFDAHADLRDEYLGEAYSHATVMRRVVEVIGGENVFQFGIRSGTRAEFAFGAAETHFYPFRTVDALAACLGLLRGRPVYVTFDLDLLDPAYVPGTGCPEPGGAEPEEVFRLFPLFRELRIVGFDLVELAPAYDPGGVSSLLAAKLAREALLVLAGQGEPGRGEEKSSARRSSP